jgi:hypothetical protein
MMGPHAFHANFHTFRNRPVFEVPEYQEQIRQAILGILNRWNIPCLEWRVIRVWLGFCPLPRSPPRCTGRGPGETRVIPNFGGAEEEAGGEPATDG